MTATVFVRLKEEVLDPQGDAVKRALHTLGFAEARDVHLGKYIELALTGIGREQAQRRTDEMCRKLLANGVIEDYRFEIEE